MLGDGMKKKILVVDDDKAMHALLRGVLEPEHELTFAVDSVQGATIARQTKPDLIILDVRMPGGGGASVFASLRMNKELQSIPVLVLTAAKMEEAMHSLNGLRPEQIVLKSAGPRALLDAVAQALGS